MGQLEVKPVLNITYYGMEHCEPSHFFGPSERGVYLLHYVLSGKGTYQNQYGTWTLKQGQGFLIEPHQPVFYQADSEEPWQYAWIGFVGAEAEMALKKAALMESSPIFHFDLRGNVSRLIAISEEKNNHERIDSRISADILKDLLSEMRVTKERMVDIYFIESMAYIESHFAEKISISDLSEKMGVNRSYLYSIYKARINMSPQDYLIHYRIAMAKRELVETEDRIGSIAMRVGYPDQLMFSKMFKKKVGLSPNQYRKSKKTKVSY